MDNMTKTERNNLDRVKKTDWQREDYKRNPEKYIAAARRYREAHPYIPHPKPKRESCKRGHALTPDNVYAYVSKAKVLVQECKICITEKNHRRADQLRNSHLKRKFNMTSVQFDELLAKQGGVCATCKTVDPKGMGSFHVDHDHTTGKIRSLLCVNCNRCLGAAKDDPDLLDTLAAYIRKHREPVAI